MTSYLGFWDSLEAISKIQTGLAILITVLGVCTLTLKLRGDHLKKVADSKLRAEREQLDAKFQKELAEAQDRQARLKKRLQPRRITETQKESLVEKLREIGPQSIVLIAPNADNESAQYKNEIRDLFIAAGWDVSGSPDFVLRDGGFFGLAAVVHSSTAGPPWGRRLQKAFEESGMKLDGRIGSKIPDGQLQLWVGQNPLSDPN